MSREIEALLEQAATEFAEDGVVSASTEARLIEAGAVLPSLYEIEE